MTSANGPTALYQALYIAMSEFKKLKKKPVGGSVADPAAGGRAALGWAGYGQHVQLRRHSRHREALRDGRLRHRPHKPVRADRRAGSISRDFELRQLAQQTGGRTFFPNQISDLATVYGQIADELSSQYTLGYTSKNLRATARGDASWSA